MLDRRFAHVIAVAQIGSFTKAAEKAGITQSGITKSVADLERELGYPLFHRTARGALQTEAGREFIDRAGRIVEEAENLLSRSCNGGDRFAQGLRIGVCPASLEWLLAAPLSRLLNRHASIRFELVSSNVERAIQLLRAGYLDVAVGFEDTFKEWSDVKLDSIGDIKAIVFVRKGHPILDLDQPSRLDLAKFDFIVPSDSKNHERVVRDLYEGVDSMHWKRRVHFIDYFPIVRHLVSTSDCMSLTTEEYSQGETFRSRYASVPGAKLFAPAKLSCAYWSRWEPSPALKAFLRVMREKL